MNSNEVYVETFGGAYYLCNPRFPGVRVALSMADAEGAPLATTAALYTPAQPQPDYTADTQQTADGNAIAAGQTIPQVVAVLGYPKSVVDLGVKKIYVYNDMKITFIAGRLSDVR